MKQIICTAAFLASLAAPAMSAPVDLSSWIENGLNGNNGAGTWNLSTQNVANDSVKQTRNGEPTVFFNPGANAQGTALKGSITVETSSDDDFIGFVLGYQDGELGSAAADFWLIDWKQISQNFYGNNGTAGAAGLALSHVTGDTANAPESDFWNHLGVVSQVQRATTLGNIGWVDNQKYEFELTFTSNLIEVAVDGSTELSFAGNFGNGAFGFYNYSQENVRYAGITDEVLPDPDPNPNPNVVPLPAGMPLLLAGIGGLAFLRRNRKA